MLKTSLKIGLQYLLVFGFVLNIYGQDVVTEDIRPEVAAIAERIAEGEIYRHGSIGGWGGICPQWSILEELKVVATEKELIALTNHKKSVIRCYAFRGMAEKQSNRTLDILQNHLKDKEEVETGYGCIVMHETVGNVFLDIIRPLHNFTSTYSLNESPKNHLDSLIVFDDEINLATKSRWIENIESKELYYLKLKDIYQKTADESVFITLVKYQKEEDKVLIKNWLERKKAERHKYLNRDQETAVRMALRWSEIGYTYPQFVLLKAISHFPDPDFFPLVQEIHQEQIQKTMNFREYLVQILYQTIVEYKTEESRKLMEKTLTQTKKCTKNYHKRYIWLALTQKPAPVFEGLIEQMKLSKREKEEFGFWLKEMNE